MYCQGPYDPTIGDIHENVTEKQTLHPFKPFRAFPKFPCYLKEGILDQNGREGAACEFKQEIVEFIVLLFPSSKKYKIWSFRVGVVQGWQRNVQNSVMRVQSCCFAN